MTLLKLESVSKCEMRGSERHTILRDVTLAVEAGTAVGIYGARYAGKSTLLQLAAGLVAPDSGRVVFDGADLAALRGRVRDQFRREVAVALRRPPEIPELTLEADIALRAHRQSPRAARVAVHAALERAGLADRAHARWSELSDTDRCFAALARVLAFPPRLLLLDDPTAGLDVVDASRVARLLREAADRDRCAVVVVAQSLASVRRFTDRVCALVNGELIEPEADARPAAPDDRPVGDVIEFPRSA